MTRNHVQMCLNINTSRFKDMFLEYAVARMYYIVLLRRFVLAHKKKHKP